MNTSHDDLYECTQASLEPTRLPNHSMEKLKKISRMPTNYCTQKPRHSPLCLNDNERFYSINTVLYSNNTLKFHS